MFTVHALTRCRERKINPAFAMNVALGRVQDVRVEHDPDGNVLRIVRVDPKRELVVLVGQDGCVMSAWYR